MCVCVCMCVCVHTHACMHSDAQLCPTLWDPMDCNLPGSSVQRISQERILEQVAISYSRGSSRPRNQTRVSCISCIGRQILWTIGEAHKGLGSPSYDLLNCPFSKHNQIGDRLQCMDLGGHNSVHSPFSVTCVRTKQKQLVQEMEMHALGISLLFVNGFNNKNKKWCLLWCRAHKHCLLYMCPSILLNLCYMLWVYGRGCPMRMNFRLS